MVGKIDGKDYIYVMVRTKGFSLVELLIVVVILMILMVISVMIFNPVAQIGKAHDAQRKKDLKLIKASFEEYFNDRGCYPTQSLIDQLSDVNNCNSISVFGGWLRPWPCDPLGAPYQFVIDNADPGCPKWYKALAKLEYMGDVEIPEKFKLKIGGVKVANYNFGVSSPNVSWDDGSGVCVRAYSGTLPRVQLCYTINEITKNCVHASSSCVAPNCFSNGDCNMECAVSKCPE